MSSRNGWGVRTVIQVRRRSMFVKGFFKHTTDPDFIIELELHGCFYSLWEVLLETEAVVFCLIISVSSKGDFFTSTSSHSFSAVI